MARTLCFILVALAAVVVLGLKSEALPKSRYSLIHAPSRVVASSTETPVFNRHSSDPSHTPHSTRPHRSTCSWAAVPAIGHDAACAQEASPAATASEIPYDYDEGNGDRNRTLPPVLALPAWIDAVNVAATKAWYTRKAISQSEIFSGLGTQSLAQQLAATTAGNRGDAILQPRSRSATKDPVGSSPSKWRSSPVATQTLLALLGAVVTGRS